MFYIYNERIVYLPYESVKHASTVSDKSLLDVLFNKLHNIMRKNLVMKFYLKSTKMNTNACLNKNFNYFRSNINQNENA